KLREVTAELGLARYSGLWNGVATGDFDGDGRPDIIASNWGRNTRYSLSPTGGAEPGEGARVHPIKLFYGDIDDVGKTDLLYSTYVPEMTAYVPERMLDFLGRSIRFFAERFPTQTAFGKATLAEILSDRAPRMQSLEAFSLESTL